MLAPIVIRNKEPALFLLEEIQAFIGSNPVKPCKQPAFFPEIVEALPSFDKCILKEIVRVIMIDNQLPDVVI